MRRSRREPLQLVLATCTVRDWRRGDEPSLVRHANNHAVWRCLRDLFPHPYTMADARRWVEYTLRTEQELAWAIAVDEFAVGAVGLRPGWDVHRFNAEIGFWLGEEFWGRGIMTEVVRAVSDHAFAKLSFHRLYAEVFAFNEASARVLEKAGYTREGVLRQSAFKAGERVDQLLYARVKE